MRLLLPCQFTPILLTLLLMASQCLADSTMRCGTRLIQKNDLAIQVKEKCGAPVSKEIIGYTLLTNHRYESNRPREYKIEQWIYGPQRGFYYEIIFEAGHVKSINHIKN